MAILAGIGMYLIAMVCLCTLVGASRKKQERCLREIRKGALADAVASPSPEELVGIRVRQARRV